MKRRLTALENDKTGLKTVFQIFVILLIFILSRLVGGLIVDVIYLLTKLDLPIIFTSLRCIAEIGLFYLFMHLYVTTVLKREMAYFRITKPSFSLFWIIISMMLPAFVILYYLIFTNGTLSYGTSESSMYYIVYALRLGLTAGITEEFLFRGLTMKLVEERWNKTVAVIVPSIIFASFHLFQGMGSIDIIFLFIAGITVSVMFALVTYLADNIWNAVTLHALWNILVIGIFQISPDVGFESLINYVIDSNNVLITGGRFGIESGLPAILGYGTVIIITFIIRRKNQHMSSYYA